jgi:hypothetical protein
MAGAGQQAALDTADRGRAMTEKAMETEKADMSSR